ncbi:site-specific integrase [Thermosporothrix hazakensis]|uniref:site-specific integrase n=1 Tax=Thermosporothrix hazakensis TaxID=644383 RepID=UPI0010F7B1A4|nr:tyrosine-type recombinase/integrase [Thermosporothrix hazakensis]
MYYDKDRDRWIVAISHAPGRRKKYSFKTRSEAIKKKNELLRELEMGMLATGPQRKLGEYIEDWIDNVHKDKLRVSSYVKYKKLIKYIVKELGHVSIQKLSPEQVQRFYAKMSREGLSSKTVHSIHGVLHLALENAVRWGYVARNVCDLVSPPRIVSREAVTLTLEQAHALFEKAKEYRLEVLLVMAVVTGMRRGELLGLRWADIDFANSILSVRRTVDYIAHYGYVETEPKTKASRRQIALPSFLLRMLQEHRVKQLEQRLKQGDKWKDQDLVFPNLQGGYYSSRYLLKVFQKILQDAKLPHMHFHDLRHSAATLLLSMGVNMKVIQALLGHSNVSITLGLYSHLLPSMQIEVTEKWDTIFRGEGREDDGEEIDGTGGAKKR